MAESLDDALVRLRAEWQPIPAIALIRRELGLSLTDAKRYLHDHPAWHEPLAKWEQTLDDFVAEIEAEITRDDPDAPS